MLARKLTMIESHGTFDTEVGKYFHRCGRCGWGGYAINEVIRHGCNPARKESIAELVRVAQTGTQQAENRPQARSRCDWLGGGTGREVSCGSGCHNKVGLYECQLKGLCTIHKRAQDRSIACCATCPDYLPGDGTEPMNLAAYFSRVYVINLARRPDRLEQFYCNLPPDWPFKRPERAEAVDGKRCRPPRWWKQGGGAWGCYKTHLRIVEDALLRGEQGNILILEDDAFCVESFGDKVREYLEELPADWDMAYLGGQNLKTRLHPPIAVTQHVRRAYNVNRTHAYAVRAKFLTRLYQHLSDTKDWRRADHIDHHLGRLHEKRVGNFYVPSEWLIGQAGGRSDVCGKELRERTWNAGPQVELASPPPHQPFIAVVGLHSSGSSCIAGVLHHIGVHLGNKLSGYYGNDPHGRCGYEAVTLARLCERAMPFPSMQMQGARKFEQDLAKWIRTKNIEARRKGTIAGGKYPLLCRAGEALRAACGDKLIVVSCDRPIEESIESLAKREPRIPRGMIERHQRWLAEGKEQICAAAPKLIRVDYHTLLADPRKEVSRIASELNLTPSPEQIDSAVASIKPDHRHVVVAADESVYQPPVIHDCTAVVKSFNRPQTIAWLLESYQRHLAPMKLIVVDDGAMPIAQPLPDFCEYVRLPFDSGLSAGRNEGVNRVSTKYMLLLDDDFIIPPSHRVECAIGLLDRHADIDIVCLPLSEDDGDTWTTYASRLKVIDSVLHRIAVPLRRTEEFTPVGMGYNAFVARTEAVRRVRWDDKLKVGEHWDFFWRAKQQGVRTVVMNYGGLIHARNEEGGEHYEKLRERAYALHRQTAARHGFAGYEEHPETRR